MNTKTKKTRAPSERMYGRGGAKAQRREGTKKNKLIQKKTRAPSVQLDIPNFFAPLRLRGEISVTSVSLWICLSLQWDTPDYAALHRGRLVLELVVRYDCSFISSLAPKVPASLFVFCV